MKVGQFIKKDAAGKVNYVLSNSNNTLLAPAMAGPNSVQHYFGAMPRRGFTKILGVPEGMYKETVHTITQIEGSGFAETNPHAYNYTRMFPCKQWGQWVE